VRRLVGLMLVAALLSGATQVSAVVNASSQSGQRASALAPRVSVLPKSVGRGDWITVVAEHLPAPVDQYCVYFDSPLGERPLAHFVPPGYGEQISPLVPGADPGTGVGAYQTWMGVTGSFHLDIASCSYGATPKTIRPVATTDFSIGNASSSPPFGLRVMGNTPLGSRFTLTLPPRIAPGCLFMRMRTISRPF